MENEKDLQAAVRPDIVYPPNQSEQKKLLDNVNDFVSETFSLFKSHTWQVVAIMCATALIVAVLVAPLATCSGMKAALKSVTTPTNMDDSLSDSIDNSFSNLGSWEECAEKFLSSCDVGYSYVQDIQVEGFDDRTLFVYVDSVDNIDSFILSATVLGHLLGDCPDGLDPLDSISVSFLDSTLILAPNESSISPLFHSMLLADESSEYYSQIKRSYDERFSLYKLDI